MSENTDNCPECDGTGTRSGETCMACNGTGDQPLGRNKKPLFIS
jgi:DnaJ-class molecular chaperone